MTREETIQLLMVIQASYPQFKIPNKEVTVNMWSTMLSEYPYDRVMVALKSFIVTDSTGFAPSIGQIINKMQMFEQTDEMSEIEAWSLVNKAIRNSSYHSQEEFDKLPPKIQKVLGSASQLRSWAIEEDLNKSVVSSQFMRSYREIAKRDKEIAMLPDSMKQLLMETANQLKIESK